MAALATLLIPHHMLSAQMTSEEFKRFVEEMFGPPTAVVKPDRPQRPIGREAPAPKDRRGTADQEPANAKGERTLRQDDLILVERGATVRSRVRPAYDALGVRAGAFILFPDLTVSEIYDDNIFRDARDERADFITVLQPRLRVASNWNRHALEAEVGAALGIYAKNPDEDYQDFHVTVGGRIDVSAVSELRARAGVRKLHSDRDSPDDSDVLEPTEYYSYSAGADYVRELGRVRLTIGGQMDLLDYMDNERLNGLIVEEVNNDDRDRLESLGRARIAYVFKTDSAIYLDSSVGRIAYEESSDDGGFDRDSMTYRTVVGIQSDINGIIAGDLHAGYLRRDFDDGAFSTIDGFTVGGTLTWNVTTLTTVAANAERSIAPTTIDNASGATVTQAGVTVDHELLRNVILQFKTQWKESDYEGIERVDETIRVGVGADVLLNRNFTFSADYTHAERLSESSDDEYSQNVLMLSLKTKF